MNTATLNREVSARTLSDLTEFYTDAEQAAIDAQAEAERAIDADLAAHYADVDAARGHWLPEQVATLRHAHTLAECEIIRSTAVAANAIRLLRSHPVAPDGSTPDPVERRRLERKAATAQNRLDMAYTQRAIILERSDRIGADVTGKARRDAIQALRIKLGL